MGGAQSERKLGASTTREMTRAVGVLAAAMVLIYVLTLAIFPGVLAEDVSNTALGTWRALGGHAPLARARTRFIGIPWRGVGSRSVVVCSPIARLAREGQQGAARIHCWSCAFWARASEFRSGHEWRDGSDVEASVSRRASERAAEHAGLSSHRPMTHAGAQVPCNLDPPVQLW